MLNKPDRPFQIKPIFKERVWGRRSLAPYFQDVHPEIPIGEAWLTSDENETVSGVNFGDLIEQQPAILGTVRDPLHPRLCPLLVKFLFTTSRLSVQVHPDDVYAHKHHHCLGKTEAWYVIESEPTGEVAIGFRETITPERLREASQSGEIEQLLDWRKVKAGDLIFTPAGTVHAIGAGVTICEIQQNSDITYRLYDYGRPRQLHLDHGCKVSKLGPHGYQPRTADIEPWRKQLIDSEYFRIEKLVPDKLLRFPAYEPQYSLLICLKGKGSIGGQDFEAGQVWFVPANTPEFTMMGFGSEWIYTYTAKESVTGLTAH